VTGEESESQGFNILTRTDANSFVPPYGVPVVGEKHTFYWSPNIDETVSIALILDAPYGSNSTIADHVKNTGEWTWDVPTDIIPGEWVFALVSDVIGEREAMIYLTIDAKTPEICGPTSDPYPETTLFYHETPTYSLKTVNTATFNPSQQSLASMFASLSSERWASITATRVTPKVSTTLIPTTPTITSGPASVTETITSTGANGVLFDIIGGTSTSSMGAIKSTSTAAANVVGYDAGWRVLELGGLVAGLVGMF